MFARIHNAWEKIRKRPGHATAVVILLLLIGLGVFVAWVNYGAWRDYDAAEKAISRGEYALAKTHLESCLRVWSSNGQVHYWMARTERSLGRFDSAAEQLDMCAELGWSVKGIQLERDLLSAMQGDFDLVESTLLAGAKETNEDTAAVLEVLAERYLQRAQFEKAMACCERLLKQFPDHGAVHEVMGQVYMARNEFDRAARSLAKAVAIQPENWAAHKTLADALLLTNRPREALAEYKQLPGSFAASRETGLGMVKCYHSLGELAECQALLEKLAKVYPQDWEIFRERGRLAWTRHDVDEAEKWLRQAVALQPYDFNTLHALVLCLSNKKNADPEEVASIEEQRDKVKRENAYIAELALKRIPKDPANPELPFELASIFLRRGDYKAGVFWLDKTLALKHDHAGATRAKAQAEHDLAARQDPSSRGYTAPNSESHP